jgi:hypothetical protein
MDKRTRFLTALRSQGRTQSNGLLSASVAFLPRTSETAACPRAFNFQFLDRDNKWF